MTIRPAACAQKQLPSAASLPRDKIVYRTLKTQPSGWVKVFHYFSIGKKVTLEFCYTPDQHLLQRESAQDWLDCYADWNDSWEALAIQLMDDFRNEIIPYWTRLTLQEGKNFRVEIEDRQPHWTPQRGGVSLQY